MTRKYIILLLFIISFSVLAADTNELQGPQRKFRASRNLVSPNSFDISTEIGENVLSREQQLILGLVVINGRQNAFRNNDGFAYYLRELLNVTGYSADEAKVIIETFKNNPEKYLSVLEKIKQNLVSNYE